LKLERVNGVQLAVKKGQRNRAPRRRSDSRVERKSGIGEPQSRNEDEVEQREGGRRRSEQRVGDLNWRTRTNSERRDETGDKSAPAAATTPSTRRPRRSRRPRLPLSYSPCFARAAPAALLHANLLAFKSRISGNSSFSFRGYRGAPASRSEDIKASEKHEDTKTSEQHDEGEGRQGNPEFWMSTRCHSL
jgi:hypothetical protein